MIKQIPQIHQELLFFTVIGAGAAFTHIMTVLALVTYLNLEPLLANIFAFLLAFNLSYLGHKHLTFAATQPQKELSLPHFFLVSSSAGILNEFLYFLLLHYTAINYLVSLVLVLGLVAIYSFLLARSWACRATVL